MRKEQLDRFIAEVRNRIENAPAEVLKQGAEEIAAHLEQIKEFESMSVPIGETDLSEAVVDLVLTLLGANRPDEAEDEDDPPSA